MSRVLQGSRIGTLLVVGMLAAGLSAGINAQNSPSTGLGQAWPNAQDMSASPSWHVYVFMLNGIKYIQINDKNGTVHAAIGTANGTSIVLPMGIDAQNVTTNSAPSTSSSAVTIYSDGTTAVTATPQANGSTAFSSSDCNVYTCTGGRGN